MGYPMNGDYENRLKDVMQELISIRKWVNRNKSNVFAKYLISYAAIKSCARIEVLVKEILYNFLTDKSNEYAQSFVSSYVIDSSDNPSTGRIAKFLESFSGEMKEKFDAKLKESCSIKSDLNSLVTLRNNFAHGRDITATIDTIIKYYKSAIEVVVLLQEALKLEDVINKGNINEEIEDDTDESV